MKRIQLKRDHEPSKSLLWSLRILQSTVSEPLSYSFENACHFWFDSNWTCFVSSKTSARVSKFRKRPSIIVITFICLRFHPNFNLISDVPNSRFGSQNLCQFAAVTFLKQSNQWIERWIEWIRNIGRLIGDG